MLKDFNKMLESLFNTVKLIVNDSLNKGQFDKTFEGIIVEKIDENHYVVDINRLKYRATSAIECAVNDIVWVTAPQSNLKKMFIAGRRTATR